MRNASQATTPNQGTSCIANNLISALTSYGNGLISMAYPARSYLRSKTISSPATSSPKAQRPQHNSWANRAIVESPGFTLAACSLYKSVDAISPENEHGPSGEHCKSVSMPILVVRKLSGYQGDCDSPAESEEDDSINMHTRILHNSVVSSRMPADRLVFRCPDRQAARPF